MTLVRATFRKQASDGSYGSESAELTLEVDLETPGDLVDPADVAADYGEGLLAMCRRRVFDELRQSPSAAVRRALEYPKLEQPRDDRAREWALSNATAEERAIRADDDERMPF